MFRFEAGYQARRPATWLLFLAMPVLSFWNTTQMYADAARSGGFLFNGTFVIAAAAVIGSLMASVPAAAVAADAGTRDAKTEMQALVFTTPVGKTSYLAGRFLAAFAWSAVLALAPVLGALLTPFSPWIEPQLLGPFRIAPYATAWLFFALPNAFIATAVLFSLAILTRRDLASYAGSFLLFTAALVSGKYVSSKLGRWELGQILDPFGLSMVTAAAKGWTPMERSTRLFALEGPLLWNRVLWVGVALTVLALTLWCFRFAHHTTGSRRREALNDKTPGAPIAVPTVQRTFGGATRLRQTAAIAWESFRDIVTGWGGLALGALTLILLLVGPGLLEHMGVPFVPTTARLVAVLGRSEDLLWSVIPMLALFYAGELVWKEREAGLGDIANATPVPDSVLFTGKLAGLALMLVFAQVLVMASSVITQARLGYDAFELGLYVRVLLGMQLVHHLLFAVLCLFVHVLVNHKHVGNLLCVVAYALMNFGPALGVEHPLMVYGAGPDWTYSDIRGFGGSVAPWLWFKLFWSACAVLLAVMARLWWVRTREDHFGARWVAARHRASRPVKGVAIAAAAAAICVGGFIVYNLHLLNPYASRNEEERRRATYERVYRRYETVLQPDHTATRLQVELWPSRGTADVRGTYSLVNGGSAPIDTIHVGTSSQVQTRTIGFDRESSEVLVDDVLGHRSYALKEPLRPGEALELTFELRFAPRGFTARGVDASVSANGTYFVKADWLPSLGYQRGRELLEDGVRRAQGLDPRGTERSRALADEQHGRNRSRISLTTLIGTDEGQLAVAPGALRRSWSENGRQYFEYGTDSPIRNDYALYSAAYAVAEGRWNGVQLQVIHHPAHAWNVDGILRAMEASLAFFTERFGPYPYKQLRFVEHAGTGIGLHASPINVSFQDGFALMNPEADRRGIDFPFAVVAHEVAHQWWGNQVTPARVEGGAVVAESLAWYSALQLVEKTHGTDHLHRLLAVMREDFLPPRPQADVALLDAADWLLAYRKGPFAMYALREHIGAEAVNAALRNLVDRFGAGRPLATSHDLYRELQAVTPEAHRTLLHDLFAANTFWEFKSRGASAERIGDKRWRVTLKFAARKFTVAVDGVPTDVPMDDLVDVGVFAPGDDETPGALLHQAKYRVRSGIQDVTIEVEGEPDSAELDPRGLLFDSRRDDNRAFIEQPAPLSQR
ncbi:M1 family aminopeptidase [Pyxidicoccus sp. 3LFB2]